MTKVIIGIILVVFSTNTNGQDRKDEYKKMIDSAIIMQPAYEHGTYLIDERDQPYILSSEEGRSKFRYINIYDKKNKKLLSKGIHAWKVFPSMEGSRLTINIVDFQIKYKKANYSFSNGGGGKVIFEYSCDSKRWVLLESKWIGI